MPSATHRPSLKMGSGETQHSLSDGDLLPHLTLNLWGLQERL